MGACLNGQTEAASLLLARGSADAARLLCLLACGNRRGGDLRSVCGTRDVTKIIAEFSREVKVDVNQACDRGYTALMWASFKGRSDTVSVLLKAGVSLLIHSRNPFVPCLL